MGKVDRILRECLTLNPCPQKPVLVGVVVTEEKEENSACQRACHETEVCSVHGKYADLQENLCVPLIIPNVFGCHLSPPIGCYLPESRYPKT